MLFGVLFEVLFEVLVMVRAHFFKIHGRVLGVLFGGAVRGDGAGALAVDIRRSCNLRVLCCLGCWLRCSWCSAVGGAGVQSFAMCSYLGSIQV